LRGERQQQARSEAVRRRQPADAEHAIRKVVTRNRSIRRRALTIFRQP
jgi:hypothetical protein